MDVVIALVNIMVGVVTLDWNRVVDGIVALLFGLGFLVLDFFRALTGGSLVGTFRDRANQWNLRRYVENKINNNPAYDDETRDRIKRALAAGKGLGLARARITLWFLFRRRDEGETP